MFRTILMLMQDEVFVTGACSLLLMFIVAGYAMCQWNKAERRADDYEEELKELQFDYEEELKELQFDYDQLCELNQRQALAIAIDDFSILAPKPSFKSRFADYEDSETIEMYGSEAF